MFVIFHDLPVFGQMDKCRAPLPSSIEKERTQECLGKRHAMNTILNWLAQAL